MGSDNPPGAGNQQERPLAAEWVVGFVDGEGCFSVPIFRNSTCRLGWQVQPEFAVVQGERSVDVLHDLKAFFGCGAVTVNRRRDNHRQDMWRFGVRRLADLVARIIPFFEHYPLLTAKAGDFASFAIAVRLMNKGVHLEMDGLRQIALIAETINRRKPSQLMESSEAIRQPPGIDVSGEDMVLASWRHGEP
jgi:LAGLIDADG endonuclease